MSDDMHEGLGLVDDTHLTTGAVINDDDIEQQSVYVRDHLMSTNCFLVYSQKTTS
jgi:hypothetical protein